ncbi:juvenile hormone acid O-methyltransferase-like isoform X1 [Choristoneura fumiferana]
MKQWQDSYVSNMEDPYVYETINKPSRRDAEEYLAKISMKWKTQDARVLDIGCGGGGLTTSVLKKFIPKNFKRLVGCDRSQNSVDFALQHYRSDKIQFIKFDIQDVLPDELKENFDHILSFYVFHWAQRQVTAFTNVYNMLAEGGNCLLLFLGRSRYFELFEELSRTPKWGAALKDIREFLTPYYDSQDPAGEVRTMMEQIGFKDIDVKADYRTYRHEGGVDEFKTVMKCLNPFDGLNDRWDEFMDECVKLDPDSGTFKYQLIVAYGSK